MGLLNEDTMDTHYSIWLMPKDESLSKLSKDMCATNNTPTFPLHITLLPRIRKDYETVKVLAKQLASTLSPIALQVKGKGVKDRCVFLGVISTQLENAAKLARTIFESEEPYTPHLGVLYADFDKTKMNSIASRLLAADVSFTIHSLHLAKTSRDVREWEVVDEVPFG